MKKNPTETNINSLLIWYYYGDNMPTAIVKLNDETNRVVNIVKAMYNLNDKSQAINKMAEEYEYEILEMQLRPEYLKKLKKIEKEKSVKIKDIDEYFGQFKKR